MVPVDEEDRSLGHKGLVEPYHVGMVDQPRRWDARRGIGGSTAVARVATQARVDGTDPNVLDAGGNLGTDAADGVHPSQTVQPSIVLRRHPKAHGGISKGRPLLVADAGIALLVQIEGVGTDVAMGDGPMTWVGGVHLPAGFHVEIAVVRPQIFRQA